MALSNITHTTIVLNGATLALTGIIGIILYIFVFWAILASIPMGSAESGSRVSPSDIIFISLALNDCICLSWYIVAGVRGTFKDVTLKPNMINPVAYIYMASRICKRYHLSLMVISRMIALKFYQKQNNWLSRPILIILLLITWGGSYAMTYPILDPPIVEYAIKYFRIYVQNSKIRDYFIFEEIASTALFVLLTLGMLPWMIHKYVTYRKPRHNHMANRVFTLTSTAEVASFVKEIRKSATVFILVIFYLVFAIFSWLLARDDGGEEWRRSDKMYMVRYFCGVYIWSLNSALPPSVFIIVEQIMQRILARLFEKRFNNQVAPAQAPAKPQVNISCPVQFDSDQASTAVVFPMVDFGQSDKKSNKKINYAAFSNLNDEMLGKS